MPASLFQGAPLDSDTIQPDPTTPLTSITLPPILIPLCAGSHPLPSAQRIARSTLDRIHRLNTVDEELWREADRILTVRFGGEAAPACCGIGAWGFPVGRSLSCCGCVGTQHPACPAVCSNYPYPSPPLCSRLPAGEAGGAAVSKRAAGLPATPSAFCAAAAAQPQAQAAQLRCAATAAASRRGGRGGQGSSSSSNKHAASLIDAAAAAAAAAAGQPRGG